MATQLALEQHELAEPKPMAAPRFAVTRRSVVIALVLAPLLMGWHIEMEALRYTFPSLMAPFYSVIFSLLCLMLINIPLKKWLPRHALKPSELLVIYVLLTCGVMWMSYDLFLPLVSIMSYAHYWTFIAYPSANWQDLFLRHIPTQLVVSDLDVLRDFYFGGSTLYTPHHLKAWLAPSLWWICFTFALVIFTHCLNVLLRRQWTENERLTYPIARIPFEITHHPKMLFGNKLFWWGFGIAAGISFLNGLNILDGRFPLLPNKYFDLRPLFPSGKPWSALTAEDFAIRVYPFAVGLGFIMPLDLLWSCLLFFFLHKASLLVGGMFGWDEIKSYPWRYEQNIGAFSAVALLSFWSARRHLWQVLRQSMGQWVNGSMSDADEPLSYRTALVGLLAGLLFIFWFSVSGGMTPLMCLLFFAAHFAIALTLTRIRAEVGFPIHSTTFIGPHHSLVHLFGTKRIGAQNLTWFSLYFWLNRDMRSYPMPHQQEAFTLAKWGSLHSRQLSRWMLTMMAIAMPICLWILLDTFFRLGISSGKVGGQINSFGGRAYGQFLQNWLSSPLPPNKPAIAAMTFGFVLTLALAVLRTRFLVWSLHPLGYGLAFHMDLFWAAFLISTLCKSALVKYAGLKVYQQATPFFFGLVLGDFVLGSIWNILSMALDRPMYTFYY